MYNHRYRLLELFFGHHGYLANQDVIYKTSVLEKLTKYGYDVIYPNISDREHIARRRDYEVRLGKFEVPLMTSGGFFIVQGNEKALLIQEHKSRHVIFTGKEDGCIYAETRLRRSRNALKLVCSDSVYVRVILEGGKDTVKINLLNLLSKWSIDGVGFVNSAFRGSKWLSAMITVLGDKTLKAHDVSDDMYNYIKESIMGSATVEETFFTLMFMLERCLASSFDDTYLSDRDHCGNKIYRSAGPIVHDLLGRAFSREGGSMRDHVRKEVYSVIKTGTIDMFGRKEANMTATVGRRSTVDAISSVRKIVVPTNVNSTIFEMRQVHDSQAGYICPGDTPEGKEVGLEKTLALTCVISPPMVDLYDRVKVMFGETDPSVSSGMVIYNGMVVGFASHDAYGKIRRLKREYPYLSANLDNNGNVDIRTNEGRLMRPLIVTGGKTIDWSFLTGTWTRLVSSGIIEYVDPMEASGLTIAGMSFEGDHSSYTHMEIHTCTMFGIAASTIPLANHNPAARVSFGSGMRKQAIECGKGLLDPTRDAIYLCHAQRPLVGSCTDSLLNLPPCGINLIVAMLCLEGSNMDDAIIVNRAIIDRGALMTLRREVETAKYEMGNKIIVDIAGPNMKEGFKYDIDSHDRKNFWVIDGLPEARSARHYVQQKMVKDAALSSDVINYGVIGDKFTSRHGQKGVIGMILPPEDLPFDEHGIQPDIIVNPHGYPSRMTIGQLIESVLALEGAKDGRLIDATAFTGVFSHPGDETYLKTVSSLMTQKVTMYNGITGKKLAHPVHMGIVYYMALPHQAKKKIYSRGHGPVDPLSKQPPEGRKREGAPRVGEMEKDALIAHGSAHILHGVVRNSDLTDVGVCRDCGNYPVVTCDKCGGPSTTSEMAYAMVPLQSVMKSINLALSKNVD